MNREERYFQGHRRETIDTRYTGIACRSLIDYDTEFSHGGQHG